MLAFLLVLQIVHLKRFQFVNGRWIKSQKIVKFPRENFDPSAFLTPRESDHEGSSDELRDLGSVPKSGSGDGASDMKGQSLPPPPQPVLITPLMQ